MIEHILPHSRGVGSFPDIQETFIDKYIADTTLTHKLLGSLRIFHPSFARNAALTSWTFLMRRSPSHFGLQILSQEINDKAPWGLFGPMLLFQKKFLLILSKSFVIYIGILTPWITKDETPVRLDLIRTALLAWESTLAFQLASLLAIFFLMCIKSSLVLFRSMFLQPW